MREGFSVSEREARQQKSASSKLLDAAGSDIFPFFFSFFFFIPSVEDRLWLPGYHNSIF